MAQEGGLCLDDEGRRQDAVRPDKIYPTDDAPPQNYGRDIPSAIVDFRGSLVSNHLLQPVASNQKVRKASRISYWDHYFRDGWDDIGIWKSAVSDW